MPGALFWGTPGREAARDAQIMLKECSRDAPWEPPRRVKVKNNKGPDPSLCGSSPLTALDLVDGDEWALYTDFRTGNRILRDHPDTTLN
jgi:hypothetical protein